MKTVRVILGDVDANKLKRLALGFEEKHGLDANQLLSLIALETRKSFSPAKANYQGKNIYAVGFIQFTASAAKDLGVSLEELSVMTATEQFKYVEEYLLMVKERKKIIEPFSAMLAKDVYMMIIHPANYYNKMPYDVILGKDETERNPAFHKDSDNTITYRYEIDQHVNEIVNLGYKNAGF